MKNRALHGLRGLASIMVVFTHIYGMAVLGGFFPKQHNAFIGFYDKLGAIGVFIFFGISGYLITKSIIRHNNVPAFLLSRVRRIYPVFGVCHVVLFSLAPIIRYDTLKNLSAFAYVQTFFSNLLLLPGVFYDPVHLPIAQKNAWTLSFEFAFYLLSGLFFLALQLRRGKPERRTLSVALLIAAVVLSLTLCACYLIVVFFLVGVAAYFTRRWIERVRLHPAAYPLDLLCYLAMFWLLTLSPEGDKRQDPMLLLVALAAFPLFVCIIREQGVLAWLMRTRPFQFYGTISYSLYLVHPFVMFALKTIGSRPAIMAKFANPMQELLVFGFFSLLLSTLAGYLAYRLLEVKLTALLFDRPARGAALNVLHVEPARAGDSLTML